MLLFWCVLLLLFCVGAFTRTLVVLICAALLAIMSVALYPSTGGGREWDLAFFTIYFIPPWLAFGAGILVSLAHRAYKNRTNIVAFVRKHVLR